MIWIFYYQSLLILNGRNNNMIFYITPVPVCPHAGGVALCEYVQHYSIFDYIAVSGSMENRWGFHLILNIIQFSTEGQI